MDSVAWVGTLLRFASQPDDLEYLSASLLDRQWLHLHLPAAFRKRWTDSWPRLDA